jgi:hypothetical protein
MVNAISFKHAMLCDDVRREDNGKLIIIGLYGGDIRVSSLPATLVLALVCECVTNSNGPLPIEVGIEFHLNGKLVTKGSMGVTIDGSGTSYLAFPRAPVQVAAPGNMEIFVTLQGQKKISAWTGDVVLLNPSAASTTS